MDKDTKRSRQKFATAQERDLASGTEVSVISPAQMIAVAVQRGDDLEYVAKLMDLERQWKEDRAREAFVEAMTQLKSEPIVIKRGHHVSFGTTEYDHASLAQVVDAVVSRLSQCGLSHRWTVDQSEGGIKVSCVLMHRLGHTESVSLRAAPDESGGKNKIQAVASTVTYLERYTLMAIVGVAAADMDNDGKGTADATISPEQLDELETLLAETGADREKYLATLEVERLEDLPVNMFSMARYGLRLKREAKK